MREIEFRGLRKAKNMVGVWAVGNYHKGALTGSAFISGYEVIPETVGQFTGLLDKNGAKIFEGDIVKHGHTCRYSDGQTRDFYYNLLVRFSENHGAWLTGDSIYLTPRNLKKYSIEVMGNIHDNPELLMEDV